MALDVQSSNATVGSTGCDLPWDNFASNQHQFRLEPKWLRADLNTHVVFIVLHAPDSASNLDHSTWWAKLAKLSKSVDGLPQILLLDANAQLNKALVDKVGELFLTNGPQFHRIQHVSHIRLTAKPSTPQTGDWHFG